MIDPRIVSVKLKEAGFDARERGTLMAAVEAILMTLGNEPGIACMRIHQAHPAMALIMGQLLHGSDHDLQIQKFVSSEELEKFMSITRADHPVEAEQRTVVEEAYLPSSSGAIN